MNEFLDNEGREICVGDMVILDAMEYGEATLRVLALEVRDGVPQMYAQEWDMPTDYDPERIIALDPETMRTTMMREEYGADWVACEWVSVVRDDDDEPQPLPRQPKE